MRLVLSTCPVDKADAIAEQLLEERLVACVNIVPKVRSRYWWEGKIATDEESLLLMKTPSARIEALMARLEDLHPYDVPEILTFAVSEGSESYLSWMTRETSSKQDG